ncbi:MAG TPA: nitrate reductase molybdenum cofactor assembly chaperone [Candidatus Acidoferrales bacterium]|nr:nitrate reductase molybdenum cofactor assembly chaperone [Candidatus Acidoferrales bacterium]
MADANEFESLAALLRYPTEDYAREVVRSCKVLANDSPEIDLLLQHFVEQTRSLSLEDLQVLYTTTFDLDPVCSLEIGWHLFGENYERGEFLVRMRGELRRLGVKESTELPDHLSHALEALGRMEPDEAADFAAACLFPALDKMAAGIKGKSNPFENVLSAATRLLEHRYPRPEPAVVLAEPAFRILDSKGW